MESKEKGERGARGGYHEQEAWVTHVMQGGNIWLTALVLMPYTYGNFVSRDWYSRDAHATRPWGSMFNPRRVRYIVFTLFSFAFGSRANASAAIPA